METKISNLIKTSLETIGDYVKCDTVMGSPINTPQGTTIIPISTVSVGFASGGLDYFGKNVPNVTDKSSFGGGGGTGISVSPVGFLVIKPDGSAEILSIAAANNVPSYMNIVNTAVDLIERSPEILAKIEKLIPKKKDDGKKDEVETPVGEVVPKGTEE